VLDKRKAGHHVSVIEVEVELAIDFQEEPQYILQQKELMLQEQVIEKVKVCGSPLGLKKLHGR